MKSLKVGIIGTGGISHFHTQSYMNIPNVEVVACADINFDRAKEYASQYGISQVFDNHQDLLKLDIDAVSVCTWNNSHARITIDALNSKKHVLCEKPLAMNYGQALLMEEAAKTNKKILMVGFVRRFGKNTALIKDFIDNGHLGEIYYAKTGCLRRCGNPTGWFSDKNRSGGGPLIDLGVHMIDLCRYLMGKPKAVTVSGTAFDNIGPRTDVKMLDRYSPVDKGDFCDVEDFASAMIRFENGAVLNVEVSFSMHIKEDKIYCEIYGTKAGAVIEPDLEIISSIEGYNVDITPKYTKDENPFVENFKRELSHFIGCIRNDEKLISPVEDGVELMKILDAVYESAKTRKEVILG